MDIQMHMPEVEIDDDDLEDFLDLIGKDGKIQEPDIVPNIPNIDHDDDDDECKDNDVEPDMINADIKSNLKNNENLLVRVGESVNAGDDQQKIMSYLVNVMNIQRTCMHQLMIVQNSTRMTEHFKQAAQVITDCIYIVALILRSPDIHLKMIIYLKTQLLSNNGPRKKMNQITNLSADILAEIEKHVNSSVMVCVNELLFK